MMQGIGSLGAIERALLLLMTQHFKASWPQEQQ